MQNATGPTHAPLSYAAAPPWHRRRAWRRCIVLVVVLAIGAAAWRWGPAAREKVRLLYWQRQALTHTASPDQIVYEEEPESAKKLIAGTGGYSALTIGHNR